MRIPLPPILETTLILASKQDQIRFLSRMLLWGAILSCIACSAPQNEQCPERPNIIFLMDDQRRWDALGVENEKVYTPYLDKLAEEGVRFSQAVCQAPMCGPSRTSMMLGLYPNQLGVLRNGQHISDEQLPIKPLAQLFADAGYETAGFGKTHWGGRPSTRGFQTRYAAELFEEGAVMMKDLDPEKKQRYQEEIDDYGPGEEDPSGYIGRTSALPESDHRDGWVLEKCLEYVQTRDDDRPLFLYLSFLKPHAAHNVPTGFEDHYQIDETDFAEQPPWNQDHSPHAEGVNRRELYEGFWKKATKTQWKEMTLRYYANCTWIDDMYGRAIEALQKKGLLENALIIYVSDHGEMLGERYYRFNKYCLYESSVRVPMIMAGSALGEEWKGKKDHRPAELIDIYPTLLTAAGIEVPERAAGLDLLDGKENRPASFCALHERKDEAAFMLRTQKHKLILIMKKKEEASEYAFPDIIGGEFYDLFSDPREWNNLYGAPSVAEKQEELTMLLLERLSGMHNQVLAVN